MRRRHWNLAMLLAGLIALSTAVLALNEMF
jgi:hypothetical protein